MAVVMVMHWPEVTPEMYDAARERVRWEEDPAIGGLSHVAWFADDGFRVVDIWETAEHFGRFAEERLMPVVKGELAIPGEPKVDISPAHRHWVPAAITA